MPFMIAKLWVMMSKIIHQTMLLKIFIDIVNEMGRQIVTNTRIVAIAEVFYNIGTAVGLGQTFLRALKNQFEDIDNVLEIISLISVSKDKLIQQKNIIMSNFFARAVLIQILNTRKQ